jgi:hypothetical protein
MNLPPPLIVKLKKGLNAEQKVRALEHIRSLKGVIRLSPQADDRKFAVLYYPGSKVVEELAKINAVDSFADAPPLVRKPKGPPH